MEEKTFLIVPEKFMLYPGTSLCVECKKDTTNECGHFKDARDWYGPLEKVNWFFEKPEIWAEYIKFAQEHIAEFRYSQEHPEYLSPDNYPDGSHGTIPFLRNLIK